MKHRLNLICFLPDQNLILLHFLMVIVIQKIFRILRKCFRHNSFVRPFSRLSRYLIIAASLFVTHIVTVQYLHSHEQKSMKIACSNGIFACHPMFSYGQRSKCADLLNSYHTSYLKFFCCTRYFLAKPQGL